MLQRSQQLLMIRSNHRTSRKTQNQWNGIRAREANPARWSGSTRDWSPLGAVTLNPERDAVVTANSPAVDISLLAA